MPSPAAVAPRTLAWARATRFFTIRPIDCVRDNPQLINVLSPPRAVIPRYPPLLLADASTAAAAGAGATRGGNNGSNSSGVGGAGQSPIFDRQRTLNFFCVAESRFDSEGNMVGHRILWRYPERDTLTCMFDANAAVLACAAPAHVRCRFGERDARAGSGGSSAGNLSQPTKHSCVMHQEAGLPSTYVTSLSTTLPLAAVTGGGGPPVKRDAGAGEMDDAHDAAAVVSLCVLSQYNRFTFFEGVLQQLYGLLVADHDEATLASRSGSSSSSSSSSSKKSSKSSKSGRGKSAAGAADADGADDADGPNSFMDLLESSQMKRCVRALVDTTVEVEFGAVQRVHVGGEADADRQGLVPAPTHALGLPVYVEDGGDGNGNGNGNDNGNGHDDGSGGGGDDDDDDDARARAGSVAVVQAEQLRWHTLVASPALPEVDAQCFYCLFSCLSVSSVMKVVGYLLTDTKVLLVSRSIALLTPVAEALSALLYVAFCVIIVCLCV
jgi:hypothetical protein